MIRFTLSPTSQTNPTTPHQGLCQAADLCPIAEEEAAAAQPKWQSPCLSHSCLQPQSSTTVTLGFCCVPTSSRNARKNNYNS